MSTSTAQAETQAEIRKVARLLAVEPDHLSYLSTIPDSDLRDVRNRIARILVESNRALIEQFVTGSAIAPTSVMVRTFCWTNSPLFTGRVAGTIEIGKAVRLAAKLPPYFLAASTAHVPADRFVSIIGSLPQQLIRLVAEESARYGDWVTLADLVSAIPENLMQQIIADFGEDALVESTFLMAPDRRREVIHRTPLARMAEIIRFVARGGRWDQFCTMADCFTPEQRSAVVAAIDRVANDTDRERLSEVVRAQFSDRSILHFTKQEGRQP
ncbi:hypothetical protein ACIRRA_35775 [Nocardia sp. NPDC101769]|uniref:hypothetical protein n=1 Tax=Nocardia sp. NPDC101769 TaxID=3364333 RepID=UPI0037F9348C